MPRRLLPLIPVALVVDEVHIDSDRITVETRPRGKSATCPDCSGLSTQVHSHYTRELADLPWQGRRVVIRVRTRRWRCGRAGCARRVFTERLPGVVRPGGRRTERLDDLHRHLGLALGGEAGSRMGARLGIPVAPDTLLRLVRREAQTDTAFGPRVLGVDDWAWRRGQRYGTILVDLERGRVVDLLPDRDAATLTGWLRRHPGVEIVARDRAGAYADGVRRGAPGAVQVADRWHLLRNASDALLGVLDRHRGAFSRLARDLLIGASDASPAVAATPMTRLEQRRRHGQGDRDARFQHVAALANEGLGLRAIVRTTGLARNTVRRWLRAGAAPTWRKGERGRLTDPFLPYLRRRVAEGERNATQLWREIRDLGFTGQVMTVRACVAGLRSRRAAAAYPALEPTWRRPTPRRAVRLLLSDDRPSGRDNTFAAALVECAPEIDRAVAETRAFTTLVRARDAPALAGWIERCRGGPLKGFAEGVRRDRSAVDAALAEPWSTSPVEGHINRLKALKRAMYGRAGLDLLRARMLGGHQAPLHQECG